MNLCADELLLRLAPPGRLVSVTWLAAGPAAIDPAAAQGLVLNHGRAEEIARLAPDLVVAGRYTTLTTTQMLRRAGIPVLLLDEATSLAGIRSQVTSLAAAVGRSRGHRHCRGGGGAAAPAAELVARWWPGTKSKKVNSNGRILTSGWL